MAYGNVRCPICSTNIQTTEKIEHCPACKTRIADKLAQSQATGITTAYASGPGLHPITDVIQDVT